MTTRLMNMTKFFALTLTLLFISAGNADAQATAPSSSPALAIKKEKFEGIDLSPSVQLALATPIELKAVSHGLRIKKKFGLSFNVYVLEFFAQYPDKIVKDDTVLSSLSKAAPLQMRLTMKRSLSGSDIADSFLDALKENGIDQKKNPESSPLGISDLLKEIESIKKFKTGDVFSLSADWMAPDFNLYVQSGDEPVKVIKASELALQKVFSIWLGSPVDDKMGELKKQLLK